MGFLDRLAAGLAWLGRCGTTAVAVSILLGILLPPLGALVRPFFPETVFLLLCLAFLRVDPGPTLTQALRLAKPTPLYGRTGVIFCDDRPAIAVLGGCVRMVSLLAAAGLTVTFPEVVLPLRAGLPKSIVIVSALL